MIKRSLKSAIETALFKGKAILLFGARQTGKTTLLKSITENYENVLWLNGDEPDIQLLFEDISSTRLRAIIGDHKIIVIDEAQRLADIGLRLKLITDEIKDIQLITTGSSSFELASQTQESLTGRKWEYHLYPLSFHELVDHHGFLHESRLLKERLVYGSYPEVVNSVGNEKKALRSLSDSYLYKDILSLEGIKKSDKLIKLLQALAFQVGNEVSYTELGQMTGLNYATVEKYIDLLEKVFVIFRLQAFSRNLRNEIKKSRKVYFYDNGIRNALIAQFQPFEIRADKGALWENYLISERKKFLHYQEVWANSYFWRTNLQQEIDYIEERDGHLYAFEFKWSPKAKARLSKSFSSAYPNHSFEVINSGNFESFLLPS